jgi:hypothetical protein
MSQKPPFATRVFEWAGGYIGCAAILGTFLGIAAGGAVGFGFGRLYSYGEAMKQKYREEREALEPIVANDPAFAEVNLYQRSSGGYDLIGVVPKQADRDRQRERVVRAFGEKRADEIVSSVMVRR